MTGQREDALVENGGPDVGNGRTAQEMEMDILEAQGMHDR